MSSSTETPLLKAGSGLARLIPHGLGKHTVARRIAARYTSQSATKERATLAGGGTFELDLSDRIQAETFVLRSYEPAVVELIARMLPDGGVFFDVGANVGLITFSVGARRPGAGLHAFEPDPTNSARWQRNRELNPEVSATLDQAAVGASEGTVELVVGEESGWGYIGEAEDPRPTLPVSMISLESYADRKSLSHVDVMKLDVEGYEPFALEGCGRLLDDRRIGCIVSELNDVHLERNGTTREALIAWLAERGYAGAPIPGIGAQRLRRSGARPADMVFTRV